MFYSGQYHRFHDHCVSLLQFLSSRENLLCVLFLSTPYTRDPYQLKMAIGLCSPILKSAHNIDGLGT